jgi:histidinol-phosphate aminotransferase
MKFFIPEHILDIDPYVPGKPIEELEREYGISDSIKIASNENPLGPSPRAVAAIRETIGNLHRYPDGAGHDLVAGRARRLGVAPSNIVIGNGSDEIIALLTKTLLDPGDEVILPTPSFLMYAICARSDGAKVVAVPLKKLTLDLDAILERVNPRTRIVFLCNPNNPTGTIIKQAQFDAFLAALPPEIVVVVDEAYIEFVKDPQCLDGITALDSGRPVATLRTFSKVYGLAGLRVGYGVMPEPLAEILNRVRPPFNVNALAQSAALAALEDREFVARTVATVHRGLDQLTAALDRMGVDHFPTQTNFFLIDVKRDADELFEAMLRQGVIVRSMRSYGYPQYIRINVGLPEENRLFIEALERVVHPSQ